MTTVVNKQIRRKECAHGGSSLTVAFGEHLTDCVVKFHNSNKKNEFPLVVLPPELTKQASSDL